MAAAADDSAAQSTALLRSLRRQTSEGAAPEISAGPVASDGTESGRGAGGGAGGAGGAGGTGSGRRRHGVSASMGLIDATASHTGRVANVMTVVDGIKSLSKKRAGSTGSMPSTGAGTGVGGGGGGGSPAHSLRSHASGTAPSSRQRDGGPLSPTSGTGAGGGLGAPPPLVTTSGDGQSGGDSKSGSGAVVAKQDMTTDYSSMTVEAVCKHFAVDPVRVPLRARHADRLTARALGHPSR
jgi:hypothetical protein